MGMFVLVLEIPNNQFFHHISTIESFFAFNLPIHKLP